MCHALNEIRISKKNISTVDFKESVVSYISRSITLSSLCPSKVTYTPLPKRCTRRYSVSKCIFFMIHLFFHLQDTREG